MKFEWRLYDKFNQVGDESKFVSTDFEEFLPPIRSFFILNTGGIPLFARRYEGTIESTGMDNSDAVLLAGFLAAVEMFSRTNLHGKLLDIGFVKERYFFFSGENSDDHLIVLSAPTSSDPYNINKENLEIIKHILSQSWEAFSLLIQTAEEKNLNLQELALSFGSTLDSIILETSYIFQVDDDDIAEEYEKSSQDLKDKSKSVEATSFERTIDKVKAFFRRSSSS